MKIKKLFYQATLVTAIGIVMVALFSIFWGLNQLPSPKDIHQALNQDFSSSSKGVAQTPSVQKQATSSQTKHPEKKEQDPVKEASANDLAEIRVLFEDLSDPRKPYAQLCANLAAGAESPFFKNAQNASAESFFDSLTSETKDPMVESAAPILRYVFRAPGMQSVLDMIVKSTEKENEGILKKAEFYYSMFRVGKFLKEHAQEMDQILQKSYNMHYLAKAVALHPELARDAATLSFCDQMEKNINSNDSYDADEAAKEMMKFLKDSGVDKNQIGYNPNYRSQVKLQLTDSQVTINDAWVAQLFTRTNSEN